MRNTIVLVLVLVVVGWRAAPARGDQAEDARQARAAENLRQAMENVKKTTSTTAKELHVKTKNDGCDGDRVLIKSAQQELRENKLDKNEADEQRKMIAEARARVACCEHPKKKGCEEFKPLPKGM
jgi:hypothetical protein